MKKGSPKTALSKLAANRSNGFQAAFNHIAVSNALLISGMFMPKLAFAAAALAAAALFALLVPASLPTVLVGATSAARSHDPISRERATEKNRST